MADSSASSSPTPSEMPDPSTSPTPSPDQQSTPAPEAPRKSSSGRGARKKTSRRRKRTTSKSTVGVKRGERTTPPPTPPSSERAKVTEDDVVVALREGGDLLNSIACAAIGVYPEEWSEIFTFTDQDLRELKGPIARIANKRIALARVVQQSDEIVVTLKLGRWAADSMQGMVAARNHVRINKPAEPAEEEADRGDVTGKVVEVPAIGGERAAAGAPEGAATHGSGDST